MMIKGKTLILEGVIGRRVITNTACDLWPCPKKHFPFYLVGMVLFVMVFIQAAPIMGEEKTLSADPPAAAESNQSEAPAPMADIHDIRPPVPVGFDAPWLMLVWLTLAGVVILAALYWWWRRHRKQRTIATIVPELPPEMVALQALDAISDVRRQDGKAFYFRLSAILRQYVFGRFGVGAPEMTTEEFLPCIERLPVAGELARQLKQLCRTMDPVKFGGVSTVEKQMESDLFFVRAFVRQTTQAAVPEAQSDASTAPKALTKGEE